MIKVQLKYHILDKYHTFFGVYGLFCPDHLFEAGTELYNILRQVHGNEKIQKAKEYVDFIKPEPGKNIVRFWIAAIQRRPSKKPGRVKKKKSFLLGLEPGSYRIALYQKNEFDLVRNTHNAVDSKYSMGLDQYLRDIMIPEYLKNLESRQHPGPGEIRAYISLYMSKKLGLI